MMPCPYDASSGLSRPAACGTGGFEAPACVQLTHISQWPTTAALHGLPLPVECADLDFLCSQRREVAPSSKSWSYLTAGDITARLFAQGYGLATQCDSKEGHMVTTLSKQKQANDLISAAAANQTMGIPGECFGSYGSCGRASNCATRSCGRESTPSPTPPPIRPRDINPDLRLASGVV